jgi:hypothetical protein
MATTEISRFFQRPWNDYYEVPREDYYAMYSNPFKEDVIKEAFSSFSGVLYCCLTTLRDGIYYEQRPGNWSNSLIPITPSEITSLLTRVGMTPVYALLALAATVEFAVRLPFVIVIALFSYFLVNCAGVEFSRSAKIGLVYMVSGECALFGAIIGSIQSVYSNLFDSPIAKSQRLIDPVVIFELRRQELHCFK